MKQVKKGEGKKEQSFTVEQIVQSSQWKEKRDILHALLDKNRNYTIKEVEEIISNFMKGTVK